MEVEVELVKFGVSRWVEYERKRARNEKI